MSNLASELEWSVCDVLLHANTFGRITRMLSNNSLRGRGGAVPAASKTDRVGINVLCRSLMLLNLYFNDKLLGQYDFVDMIGEYNLDGCRGTIRSQCVSPAWIRMLMIVVHPLSNGHSLHRPEHGAIVRSSSKHGRVCRLDCSTIETSLRYIKGIMLR